MSSAGENQCKAITESGQRCSRHAGENGYCYQHGPDDEAVDGDNPSDGVESADGSDPSDDSSLGVDGTDESDGRADTQYQEHMSESNQESTSINEVREKVETTAEDIVGRPLDGIISINREEENWRVAIEVIERKGVPDTQDILGRYEIILDERLTVTSYHRTTRYRRDDMDDSVR